MIVSFRDRATRAVFHDEHLNAARRRLPSVLWKVAQRKLDLLGRVSRLEQLSIPPANRLERLRGNREGQHSIRINDQYRICFVWTSNGPAEVEIADYH